MHTAANGENCWPTDTGAGSGSYSFDAFFIAIPNTDLTTTLTVDRRYIWLYSLVYYVLYWVSIVESYYSRCLLHLWLHWGTFATRVCSLPAFVYLVRAFATIQLDIRYMFQLNDFKSVHDTCFTRHPFQMVLSCSNCATSISDGSFRHHFHIELLRGLHKDSLERFGEH